MNRVVLINTTDRGGGAERMATDVLDGFQRLGTQTTLLVGAKQSQDSRVIPFYASPHLDYRPQGRRHRQAALRARRRLGRRGGLEDFEHPYSRHALELSGARPDLVLCGNLHGGYFDLRTISALSHQVPVVLRLDDSWLLTGHCSVPRGCPRWETGCGSCPDLQTAPAIRRDATRWNWRRKRRILAGSRLALLSPSQWMMRRAQRSLLSSGVEQAAVIANGVDVKTLTPGDRLQARSRLGIAPDADVLAFVAHGGHENPYKDFATLRGAMAILARRPSPTTLELLSVGVAGRSEQLNERTRIRHLERASSREELRTVYRAADLYVHASWEESFGLTTAEALACGLPVVATAAGAVPEVVDDGVTGSLVPVGDTLGLAVAIGGLLADHDRRARMSRAAVESARARFDSHRQVAATHAWCEEVVARWHRRAS